jgi:L-alanine-DL-glutamate epimerase-like enolase superfamily enzyme
MELHVSLSAAVPNGRWVEWIPQLAPVTTTSITVINGRAHPPTTAWLGISWDDEAIERLLVVR